MPRHGLRSQGTAPAGEAAAQAELSVVPIKKERLIEEADLVEHRTAIQRSRPARKQRLPLAVVLPAVFLEASTAPIEPVPIQEVPDGVDDARAFVIQDLGGDHADACVRLGGGDELSREARLGAGVTV